jgi:chemotaxis protein methyltransferase CheR
VNLARPPAAANAIAARSAPREFPFTEREFDRIARILHDRTGIDMPRSKEALVYARLAKRLRQLGLDGFGAYLKLVEAPDSDELDDMLAALTTNVTRFFREPHHFDDMRNRLLPGLAAAAKKRTRVRFWSSACSTGEEPYSMALTLLETLPEAPGLDVRILATDINGHVLRRAAEGVYPRAAVAAAPPELVRKYFRTRDDDTVQATDELRSLIAFLPLNLMGDWPMRGQFDAIFCRNVAIYFNDEGQARLWRRLAEKLAPGGHLYIGHAERVTGPAVDLLQPCGVTAYARRSGES